MKFLFKFTNKVDDELDSVAVQDSFIKCCSIGLSLNESWHTGENSTKKESTDDSLSESLKLIG